MKRKKKMLTWGFNLVVMVMMMRGRSSSPSSSFLFPTVSNHLKEKKKDWKKRTWSSRAPTKTKWQFAVVLGPSEVPSHQCCGPLVVCWHSTSCWCHLVVEGRVRKALWGTNQQTQHRSCDMLRAGSNNLKQILDLIHTIITTHDDNRNKTTHHHHESMIHELTATEWMATATEQQCD